MCLQGFSTRSPYYRICSLLILPLYLPHPSAAAPVRETSTSTNWLACLTVLLIFSAVCLSAFKFLFIRHRKASNLKGPQPTLEERRYIHPAFGFLKLPAYATWKNHKRCKAGFLIGFFGSPSFEIRPKPSEITLIYPGINTSKSSRSHDFSGDSSTTYKSKRSTFSSSPAVLFSENNTCCTREQIEKCASFPVSLTRPTKSRFMLPTQFSFDLGRIRRKKKLVRTQTLTSVDTLPWPHNRLEHATLRLVKLYTEPEAVLPLCIGAAPVPGLSSPVAPVHGFAVAHLNRPHPLPISSLPSLPVRELGNERMANYLPLDLVGNHPYNNALLNLVKPGRQSTRRASLSPNLSVIEEARHGTLPDCPSVPALNQSLASDTNEHIMGISTTENVNISHMNYTAYDALKRRKKKSVSSFRSRRSPPLGPSPLRSMILPEITEGHTRCTKSATIDEIEDFSMPRRRSIQYHQIGLGLPSFKLSLPTTDQDKSQNLTDDSSEGRESVLDFLRELAEETKEWDESIVLDEGFRNMIQRSQGLLGCVSPENMKIKCSTPIFSGAATENTIPTKFVSLWIEDSPSP